MFLQKLVVVLQLLAALSVEALRLLGEVGSTALLPPEGASTARLSVDGKVFELRLHVKRVA